MQGTKRYTMSTLAYAAITRAREAATPGKSTTDQKPGVRTYIDALAALVPAEVLAAHATILTFTTKTTEQGNTSLVTVQHSSALQIAFYALVALSMLLYAGGRLMESKWDKWDWLRVLIPPLAFVGWTMLQKATAFDAVVDQKSLDEATRNVIAIIGGIVLGIAAAALAYKADQKPA
jgi:hypothetical protein